MGSSSKPQTTTVTQTMSPQQRAIMTSAMNYYMPGGQFLSQPQFSLTNDRWRGEQRVAPLSPDQQTAFQATRDMAFGHQPQMGMANAYAAGSYNPFNTYIAPTTGWNWQTPSTGPGMTGLNGTGTMAPGDPYTPPGSMPNTTGTPQSPTTQYSTTGGFAQPTGMPGAPGAPNVASFMQWSPQALQQFASPYTQGVIDTGLNEINRQGQITQRGINDAALAAGAFGGSRHGVQAAETERGLADMKQKFLADTLDRSYGAARDQYNQSYAQGMGALGFNQGVNQQDYAQGTGLATLLSNLAGQTQALNARGTDALAGVGGQIQQNEQAIRDTSYSELMNEFLFPAQLAQMLQGFAPAPSTTQTTTGIQQPGIWGNALGALGSIGSAAIMFSDERLKEDVKTPSGEKILDELRRYKPVEYAYTKEARERYGLPERRTGFMAQDVERVSGKKAPEIADGWKGIDMADLLGKTVIAVQELDRKLKRVGRK